MKDVVRGTDDGEGSAKLVHQVQVRFKLSELCGQASGVGSVSASSLGCHRVCDNPTVMCMSCELMVSDGKAFPFKESMRDSASVPGIG